MYVYVCVGRALSSRFPPPPFFLFDGFFFLLCLLQLRGVCNGAPTSGPGGQGKAPFWTGPRLLSYLIFYCMKHFFVCRVVYLPV